MSNKIPETQSTEEVDLGQIFKLIGRLFDRLYNFIASIFLAIFTTIISALKAILRNFKLISAVVLISSILGFIKEKTKPESYSSSMMVKTFFDTKYQLNTNIDYFNAIIADGNFNALSTTFEISKESAEKITEFKIEPGPETENSRILQYEGFIRSIDSLRAQNISYEDFVDNRSIYTGNLFVITVMSTEIDVFLKLGKGFSKTFVNLFSKERKRKRDSIITIQEQSLLASIKQIQILKDVYINVLEEESKSTKASINIGDGFPLQQSKTVTKEFDLLKEELDLLNQLAVLEEEKIEDDVLFEVVSDFQAFGKQSTSIFEKYSLILPVISFVLLCLVFLTRKTITFVNNYEE